MTPLEAMRLAISEARRGVGFVAPNPLVGCVILDANGQLLAAGHHARIGQAHAEIHALNQISDKSKLKGAQVYVTLEPCAHHGRTPPCAEALAALPIASVTYGLDDPNPKVSGKGAARLREAGIKVDRFPELINEFEEVAEVFLTNQRHKRPFVAMKVASSLDGQIAMKSGESKWITGELSRDIVQFLRGTYDAVAVGAGTFKADDPRLDSREERFKGRPNRAVLFDADGTTLSKLADSNLLKVRQPSDLFVVVKEEVRWPSELSKVNRIALRQTDWVSVLGELYKAGLTSLFVEGGAGIVSSLIAQNQVDRVYAFIAPKILGARSGLSWTSELEIANLGAAPTLHTVRSQALGPDILITGRISPFG